MYRFPSPQTLLSVIVLLSIQLFNQAGETSQEDNEGEKWEVPELEAEGTDTPEIVLIESGDEDEIEADKDLDQEMDDDDDEEVDTEEEEGDDFEDETEQKDSIDVVEVIDDDEYDDEDKDGSKDIETEELFNQGNLYVVINCYYILVYLDAANFLTNNLADYYFL